MVTNAETAKSQLRFVQVVNTLSVADGGPARNAYELNKALTALEGGSGFLFWIRGTISDSILNADRDAVVGKALSDSEPTIRKISWRTKRAASCVSWRTFFRTLRNSDVLVLHGYYLTWVPFIALVGKMAGCKVVLTPHGSLTARQQKYSKVQKKIFDLTVGVPLRASLSAFVTGSEIERVELAEKFPTARARVGGVGVQMPLSFKESQAPHDPLRLLSMSRIAAKKRIDISIDTVNALKAVGINSTLTVAGIGKPELVEQLKSRVRQLGLEDQVKFVGQLTGEDKQRAFLDADVFVLPSEDENFGIGFAEATSFGLPCVVSTKVAAALSLPVNAGHLIENPNGEKMANAILSLTEPSRFVEAQSASRKFASRNFSWTAAANSWVNVALRR